MYSKQDFSELLAFLMKENVNFMVATVKYWSPLNNKINFVLVNCLQQVL